jgi:hypothetical protein
MFGTMGIGMLDFAALLLFDWLTLLLLTNEWLLLFTSCKAEFK